MKEDEGHIRELKRFILEVSLPYVLPASDHAICLFISRHDRYDDDTSGLGVHEYAYVGFSFHLQQVGVHPHEWSCEALIEVFCGCQLLTTVGFAAYLVRVWTLSWEFSEAFDVDQPRAQQE